MKVKTQYVEIEPNINIWVENYGDIHDEACLFVAGAGANCSFWSDSLCEKLVEKGFFVLKYDHRDFGLSTKIDFVKNPYNVMDLANDAVCIMDAFNVKKVHVIGHSMGGFIAQLLAIHFPERILSIISASSSTNSSTIPPPPEKTWEIFLRFTPCNNFEKDLSGFLLVWNYLNGTAKFDEELAIEYTKNIYKRQEIKGALGEGHVKAQSQISDRSEFLKNIQIPALVIHGEQDYLVDKYGGIQTAECIKKSKLILLPEMGHLLFNHTLLKRFEN